MELTESYIRRKQWEYRSQAVSVVNAYAEAMSGGQDKSAHAPRQGDNVPGDVMLRMLGAKGI